MGSASVTARTCSNKINAQPWLETEIPKPLLCPTGALPLVLTSASALATTLKSDRRQLPADASEPVAACRWEAVVAKRSIFLKVCMQLKETFRSIGAAIACLFGVQLRREEHAAHHPVARHGGLLPPRSILDTGWPTCYLTQ